jgi:hypothetical protein
VSGLLDYRLQNESMIHPEECSLPTGCDYNCYHMDALVGLSIAVVLIKTLVGVFFLWTHVKVKTSLKFLWLFCTPIIGVHPVSLEVCAGIAGPGVFGSLAWLVVLPLILLGVILSKLKCSEDMSSFWMGYAFFAGAVGCIADIIFFVGSIRFGLVLMAIGEAIAVLEGALSCL